MFKRIKAWLNNQPSNALLNINIVFAILGVLISALLSFLAVYLTYKYGENTDQINKLREIAKGQNTQIEKLGNILLVQQQEDEKIKDVLLELKKSNDGLIVQTRLLQIQANVLRQEQTESNKLRTLSRKSAYVQLKNATTLYMDQLNSPAHKKDYSDSLLLSVVTHVSKLLESELSNVYLLENESVTNQWINVYLLSLQKIDDLTTYNYNSSIIDLQKKSPAEIKEETRKLKLVVYQHFVGECRQLFLTVDRQMKWKKGQEKIFFDNP